MAEEILHKKVTKRRKLNFRDKLLADKIRWYRRDRDLTQEQLAEKSRISCIYIIAIENYNRGVSLPILYKLSRVFKIKVKDLFDF